MAIKGADLITVGNQVLVDRVQSTGPGNLSIPTERIYELGNYETVAIVRDTPDLSFPLDSLDASAEFESLLLGTDFTTDAAGTAYNISRSLPMDVVSQFKGGRTAASPFNIVGSVAVPHLTLESLSYKFGLPDKASESANFKGDGVYYSAGSAYVQVATGTAAANQVVTLAHTAIVYNGDALVGPKYALNVSLVTSGVRLVKSVDYTETSGAVTILAAVPITEQIRVVYQSATVAAYPQVSHEAASATRPAAIKGRDIEILVGGAALSNRWSSVQSVAVDYRVTLERDEEFSNYNVVDQNYEVPAVTGTIDLKPRNYAELMTRLRQITGTGSSEVIGARQSAALPLQIVLHSPTDGTVLKTLYVADARFTLPGYSAQVQQKMTVSIPWESDGGSLVVYKNAKP